MPFKQSRTVCFSCSIYKPCKIEFFYFKTGCGDKSTSSLGEHSGDREADKLGKSAIHLIYTCFVYILL